MMRGTYIGPIEHLIGQRALLRDDPESPGFVHAQFEYRCIRRSTPEPFDYDPPVVTPIPADALGFGWHQFVASDFQVSMRDALVEPTPLEDWQDSHAMPMRSDRSHLHGHS